MFRTHLAAAVLVGAALVPSTSRASNFGLVDSYWSSWNLGGSWETIPAEFVPRYDSGYDAGYPIGYRTGFGEGQVRGRSEGWANGKSAGHSAGWDEAYPLAFNLGYDEAYPGGHFAGWEDGLEDGFKEGYNYAPVVAQEILKNWYGGGSYNGTLSFSGVNVYSGFSLNLDGIFDSGIAVWKTANDDWSRLAYSEGFKVGKDEGYAAGSTDGYDETYGPTYAQAYPIGHQLGIWEGTTTGKREGNKSGYDEGWDVGHDLGYDAGFYAGIEYHLFGEYALPQYSLQYSRRGSAVATASLVAMNAPEPTSAMLLAVGGIFAAAIPRRMRPGLSR